MGQFGGPFENKSEKLWDELYMKTLSLKLLSPILLASKQTTRASNLSLGLDDLIFLIEFSYPMIECMFILPFIYFLMLMMRFKLVESRESSFLSAKFFQGTS